MGKMVFQYEIKTPSPDTNPDEMVNKIRENLPDGFTMQQQVEIKPMFFGIKAVVCQFVCSDEDGTLQDQLENYLTDLDGLGEHELTFSSRL